MRKLLATALLFPLIACGPVLPGASLPLDAVQGGGDPMRAAIYASSYAFNNPGGLADPAVAARASAQVEYLAVTVPIDPRYSFTPTLAGPLAAARDELHAALGVAATAPPQAVVEGLYGASRALSARNPGAAADALSPAVFPNRQLTLARLSAPGPLPLTAVATAQAEREQLRFEQERVNNNSGGDSSGGRSP